MNRVINISFDIDGTLLNNTKVQEYCKLLCHKTDVNLWIHTRRYESKLMDERETVMDLGIKYSIPNSRIIFTNRNYKHPYLKFNQIDCHLDDDMIEVCLQPVGDSNRIICTSVTNWEYRFKEFLRKHNIGI